MHADNLLWATLARTPTLDALTLRRLAAQLAPQDPRAGCAALLTLSGAELRAQGLNARAAAWLTRPRRELLDADLTDLELHGLQLLPAVDPHYPPQLAQLPGAPAVLWLRGAATILAQSQLAIVGTRSPTSTGLDITREFASYCARGGLIISSGLALGIDGAAHLAALEAAGTSIAVCGTGLARHYPRDHAALAERIVSTGGALISELAPQQPPRAQHFRARNRILSGLACAVLVVEAARHSGSLSTARHAWKQARPVFAIPGSIYSPMSQGCHELIRHGARLLETPADVFSELNIPYLKQSLKSHDVATDQRCRPTRGLDNACEILLHAVAFEATSMDVLMVRTGLSSQSVASMLLMLELEGLVAPQPGGRYIRTRGRK